MQYHLSSLSPHSRFLFLSSSFSTIESNFTAGLHGEKDPPPPFIAKVHTLLPPCFPCRREKAILVSTDIGTRWKFDQGCHKPSLSFCQSPFSSSPHSSLSTYSGHPVLDLVLIRSNGRPTGQPAVRNVWVHMRHVDGGHLQRVSLFNAN